MGDTESCSISMAVLYIPKDITDIVKDMTEEELELYLAKYEKNAYELRSELMRRKLAEMQKYKKTNVMK